MNNQQLEFPCEFPIKVFGTATEDFEKAVIMIIRKHVPDVREDFLKSRPSKDGKYIALTLTVHATSREQLDTIYQDLTSCPYVLMAL